MTVSFESLRHMNFNLILSSLLKILLFCCKRIQMRSMEIWVGDSKCKREFMNGDEKLSAAGACIICCFSCHVLSKVTFILP